MIPEIFSEWIEASHLVNIDVDSKVSAFLKIEEIEVWDSWVRYHPGSGGLGSLSRLLPATFQITRLKIIQCILYHCQLEKHIEMFFHTKQIPSGVTLHVWSCALNCLESQVRACIQCKQQGVSLEDKCREACKIVEERLQYLMNLEPASAVDNVGDKAAPDCRKSIVRDITEFLTSAITTSEWESLTQEMERCSLSADLKTVWITSSLKVLTSSCAREKFSSEGDSRKFSEAVIDGFCGFLPVMLSHIPSAEFSCTANLALNLPADRLLESFSFDGFGCNRFVLNRLFLCIIDLCAFCGDEIAKAIQFDSFDTLNQNHFRSRNISSLLSLLVVFCTPALSIQIGNCIKYPIIEAALLSDLWRSLSQIRLRTGSTLPSSSTDNSIPDELIRRAHLELYHCTWIVMQLLTTQYTQVNNNQLSNLSLSKDVAFEKILKACVEDSAKIIESMEIDSSRYWEKTGKNHAKAIFERFLKTSNSSFVGKFLHESAAESLVSPVSQHLSMWLKNSVRR
jgi:hypothetical protein